MRLFVLLAVVACDAADQPGEPKINWATDIIDTSLALALDSQTGVATIKIDSPTDGASFEVGDLTITSVQVDGRAAAFERVADRLDVATPAGRSTVEIIYAYALHGDYDGFDQDFSFTWPYHCGNAFPCKSDPADGMTFSIATSGGSGKVIAPASIATAAPSYMLAWAQGEYGYQALGTTDAGTEVGYYYFPEDRFHAQRGAANLLASFAWLENNLGAYPFGAKAASVQVDWGPGAFGGMEHHPYWHIGSESIDDEETHAHEAAHAWFGNGVRIACWEDFVLSEGIVTYLSIRALAEVDGPVLWDELQTRLARIQNGTGNKVAWPKGCNEIDILNDGLYGDAPYTKGALFAKSVADAIGSEKFHDILAKFFAANVGKAARMQALVDFISNESGWDASECARVWLREATPAGHEDACAAD